MAQPTVDQLRDVLKRTVDGLRAEATALDAARDAAGENKMKLLEEVGPIMAKVQYPLIAEIGFGADESGLEAYTQCLDGHSEDEDVASLTALVHVIVLFGEGAVPKLQMPGSAVSYEQVLLSARGVKPP